MTPNDEGKLFTPAEAKQLREKLIRKWVLPAMETRFAKYPTLQSAGMFIAQYYDDVAYDSVHLSLIYSVLETPDFAAILALGPWQPAPANLSGLPLQINKDWLVAHEFIRWDDLGIAIPAFAAFCREGCHQEMEMEEAYSLFAIFRKTTEGIEVENVGEMIRPWLDGIAPEFFERIDGDEISKTKAEYLESLDP